MRGHPDLVREIGTGKSSGDFFQRPYLERWTTLLQIQGGEEKSWSLNQMSNFLAEKVACYANFLSIAVQGERTIFFKIVTITRKSSNTLCHRMDVKVSNLSNKVLITNFLSGRLSPLSEAIDRESQPHCWGWTLHRFLIRRSRN